MKIVIPGGSGQIGTVLSRAFLAAGHDVVVLSRHVSTVPWRVVQWDAETLGDWADELSGADVLINLAGRSVNCRYHSENRRQIMDSRVNSTRLLGQALASVKNPPPTWLQSSTATIYAHRFDAPNDEYTGIIGGAEPNSPSTWRFSIDVAKAWEKAADDVNIPGTRLVKLRSAMVMSPDAGGVFDTFLGLVRFGLGGAEGNGRQFVSWVHDQDFFRALIWIIEHENLDGVVNIASPGPIPNAEFLSDLRKAWGTNIGLPATAWMLEIGTFLLQSETELILKSRRVIPTRLLQSGFEFQFPNWPAASQDLVKRWRSNQT